MAISTLDGYIAAAKQRVLLKKTATRATVANGYFSLFDIAGSPGAGTLAGVNTANGVVPDDSVAGYPLINAFGGGSTGYLGRVEYNGSVACRLHLYDRLFVAGAFAFNANINLTSQPSFSGRLPESNFNGLEIWVEQVTAATGNQAVAVTYTNENDVTTRSTGAVGIGAAPTIGRCWQLPLQAGDKAVKAINSVVGSVASAGTFNVMVLRPLWSGRCITSNYGDIHDAFGKVGLPKVFDTSAFFMMINADSTSSGLPELMFDVVNG